MSHIHVYFHTDRPNWDPPPASSRFHASAGWFAKTSNLSSQRAVLDPCIRAPWNLDASFKYDWVVSSLTRANRDGNSLHMLADSDILFQCSADELAARFASFGSDLVVSTERRWFPLPRNAHDPFGPPSNMSVCERGFESRPLHSPGLWPQLLRTQVRARSRAVA